MNLIESKKIVLETEQLIASQKKRHKEEIEALEGVLKIAREEYNILLKGKDLNQIQLAEKVMVIGRYQGIGDQPSCVRDMIKWLSGVPTTCYRNPPEVLYGTKNYSQWSSQRSDHDHYSGPAHGHLNFQIGVNRDLGRDLTDEEKCACLYYLENIKEIQAAKEGK